ncbi:MAG: VCBS repeat-containing protein [Polyangiaceae bacterium]|nr:VCBS repeat-containing protein [Polyangiaceae bacterium]
MFKLPAHTRSTNSGRVHSTEPQPDRSGRRLRQAALFLGLLGTLVVPACSVHNDTESEAEDWEDLAESTDEIGQVNIAQGKPATQSTTHSAVAAASKAVDGNTSGQWGDGSVSHTLGEASPWWKVDLGLVQYLGTVELYNRTDCCSERLSNFKVLVSDDDVNWEAWDYAGTAGQKTVFDIGRNGRYVKIQLNANNTTRYLQLAEVKVFSASQGSSGSTALAPTVPVGSLGAQFTVDAHGSSVYSIPLEVPPGTREVEPAISLVYKSGGGNGPLGSGWALGGLSAIERCPKKSSQDATIEPIKTIGNAFCLDGQRLIKIWQSSSETHYRTENESFSEVIAYTGNVEANPLYFRVRNKSGQKAYYGNTADSRGLFGPYLPARTWAINKLEDRNGNYMTYSYTAKDGYLYPADIVYTRNDAVPTLKKRRVNFSYETRPDAEWRYVDGNKLSLYYRLNSVKTYIENSTSGESLVRDYRITYTTSPLTGRSTVQTVKECDGANVCLPATQFEYFSAKGESFISVEPQRWDADEPNSADPRYDYQGRMHSSGAEIVPGDYNGDGKTDFIRREVGQWAWNAANNFEVYLSSGNGRFTIITPDVPYDRLNGNYTVLHPTDVNGDGFTDFFRQERSDWGADLSETFDTYISNGNGTFTLKTTPHNLLDFNSGYYVYTGDFNGDGRAEFIAQPHGAFADDWYGKCRLRTYRSTYGPFDSGELQDIYKELPVDGTNWFGCLMNADDGSHLILGDYNGDGITDFLRQEHTDWDDDSSHQIQIYFADSALNFSMLEPHKFVANNWDQVQYDLKSDGGSRIIPGDFNGDGITDFIRQEHGGWATDNNETFRVYFSDGRAGVEVVSPVGSEYQYELRGDFAEILPIDFNGDGRTDFLRRPAVNATLGYLGTPAAVYVSRGDGTFEKIVPNGPLASWFQTSLYGSSARVFPGDYNGDGKTDLIRQKLGGDLAGLSIFQVLFAQGDGPVDHLKKVTNGLNGTLTVQYAPLTDSSVYTKGGTAGLPASLYPFTDVQNGKYVVKSYQSANGWGSTINLNYKYAQAVTAQFGEGFLGFGAITAENTTTGTATTTEYHQEISPLSGSVKSRTVKKLGGSDYVKTDYTYQVSNTTNSSVIQFVRPTKEEVLHVEGANSYKTVSEFEYDEFGNLTILHQRGLENTTADDVDTCTSYSRDTAGWYLNTPLYTRVAKSCTMVNNTCNCTNVLQLVDRYYNWANMNLLEVYQYDDRYNTWPRTVFTYDEVGNVLTRFAGTHNTGTTDTNTYDPVYKTFLIKQITTGGTLSQEATYSVDPRFGVVVSQTDASGNTNATRLDGLGRVVQKSRTSPSGQVVPVLGVTRGMEDDGAYQEIHSRRDWNTDSWEWQREYIDEQGRVWRTKKQQPSPQPAVVTEKFYDGFGEVWKESLPHKDTEWATYQTFTRDWLGRVIESKDALGTISRMVHAIDTGACTGCTYKTITTEAWNTPKARSWTRHVDMTGAPRLQIDPEGHESAFGYDLLGRRTSVADAGGTTTTVYDSLNRVTSVTSPDRGTLSNDYDFPGRLAKTVEGNGKTTNYSYDDLGRVTQKSIVSGETTTFAYDSPTQQNAMGRLSEVTVTPYGANTPSSKNTFGYTPDGAIATNVVTIDSSVYTIQSSYDPQGRLQTLTYPDGKVLTRTFAVGGNLAQLKVGNEVYADYATYTPRGQIQQVAYKNGVTSTFSYDGAGRLSGLLTERNATANQAKITFQNYVYAWDPLYQLTQLTNGVNPDRSQTFTYSPAGNLTGATGIYGNVTYGYDAAGNLTTKEGQTYTYSGHRVTWVNNNAVLYDGSGNRTQMYKSGATFGYTYGPENRLLSASKNGVLKNTFAYDFTGERVKKVDVAVETINGVPKDRITHYVTPAFEVTFLPNGNRVVTNYVLGPAGRVAAISDEIPPSGAALMDFEYLERAGKVYTASTLAGVFASAVHRAGVWSTHRRAPPVVWLFAALGTLVFAWIIAGRLAPTFAKRTASVARAIFLPQPTAFARKNPVYAWLTPLVAAAFLSACGPQNHPTESIGEAEQALTPGANGAGNPVEGTFFFHQNHIGSSSLVTDAAGWVVASAEYKPYGEVIDLPGDGTDMFRSKFGGKEWDSDSQLYYFNARYYDPLTGRFMSPDAQLLGGDSRSPTAVNPYAYGNNSPMVYTDPSGQLFWFIVIGVIVGAYMGAAAANGTMDASKWNWTSWKTWTGLLVGGLIGGIGGAAGGVINGIGGIVVESIITSVGINGLKFMNDDYTPEQFGKDVGIDIAVGLGAGGLGMAAGKLITKGASKVAKELSEEAARQLGKNVDLMATTSLNLGLAFAMNNDFSDRGTQAHQIDTGLYNHISRRSPISNRWQAPNAPETINANAVNGLLRQLSESLLTSTGADAQPGRAMSHFRSKRPKKQAADNLL